MRLNFTFADKEDIEKGIKVLCRAVREQMKQLDAQDESVLVEINPIV